MSHHIPHIIFDLTVIQTFSNAGCDSCILYSSPTNSVIGEKYLVILRLYSYKRLVNSVTSRSTTIDWKGGNWYCRGILRASRRGPRTVIGLSGVVLSILRTGLSVTWSVSVGPTTAGETRRTVWSSPCPRIRTPEPPCPIHWCRSNPPYSHCKLLERNPHSKP